jgi:cytochrome c oxidase subunit 3
MTTSEAAAAHEPLEHGDFADHFNDLETQEHASRLGMWIFMASETLLFAGLLALYTAYRIEYSEGFQVAARENNVLLGTAMTVILLVSSYLVATGVLRVRAGDRRAASRRLWLAVALGAAFLGCKIYEYADHFAHGIAPGGYYRFAELPGDGPNTFFTLYYMLSGLHALHVVAGMVILAILAILLRRGHFAHRHAAVENGGLYWHLVDIIWIFLWPMLYLIG